MTLDMVAAGKVAAGNSVEVTMAGLADIRTVDQAVETYQLYRSHNQRDRAQSAHVRTDQEAKLHETTSLKRMRQEKKIRASPATEILKEAAPTRQ